MAERDYILRLIEQMGQLLISVRNRMLGRRASSREVADALEQVSRHTGIDLALARSATPDTLRMIIAPTGEVEPGRCWLVAEMMGVDGLEAEITGDTARALGSYERAIALFGLLEPWGAYLVGFPEASQRIQEIGARMSSLASGTAGTGDEGSQG